MNSFITLAVIIFIFYIAARAIRKINLNSNNAGVNPEKGQGFDPNNYELRQTLMTSNERIFFEKLRRAIGDKYDIYPQVNLDKIFKVKYLGNKFAFNAAKWAIDRRSIDFLITKRESQSPYIGIELDDSTHYREDRVNRDEKVNSLFKENGIELMRVNGINGISEEELRTKFN